jgi:hypothetical protein
MPAVAYPSQSAGGDVPFLCCTTFLEAANLSSDNAFLPVSNELSEYMA